MPMSKPPEDPPPKDRLTLHDVERFHTKALDLGAVRAIDRAGQAAANDFASGNPVPSVHRLELSDGLRSKLPAIDRNHCIELTEAERHEMVAVGRELDRQGKDWLVRERERERERMARVEALQQTADASEGDAAVEERTEASPWESEPASAPIERDALPSAQLARNVANAKTIEIDYSPTSRAQRTRSVLVQRTARIVTVACVAVALALTVWALARTPREAPPLAIHGMPAIPAPTSPAAPSIEAGGTTEIPPSTATASLGSSTVPTVVVPATAPASRTPPQPTTRAVSPGTAVSAPSSVPTPTATPEVRPTAAPSNKPSATIAPAGGTVDLPIPE